MLVLPALKQLRVPGEGLIASIIWSSELFATFLVLEFSFFQILKVLAARVLYVGLYKSRVSVLLVTVY